MTGDDLLSVGEISGVFGVKGWVKVYSFTSPRENVVRYSPWFLRKNGGLKELKLLSGRLQGNGVVALVQDVNDRDQALELVGSEVLIRRAQLPLPEVGEYYWADLEGLDVRTESGYNLGKVDHLLETGSNDVLVVVDGEKERLIPFIQPTTVVEVDLENRLMLVDWDPDF